MAISLRVAPELEARIEEEARRLGVTKTEFVKDAIERVLGYRNPATLLSQVRSGTPSGDPHLSENVSRQVKDKLREKRPT